MYRAIVKIGKYKVGEEVPTEQAEIWLKAYKIPQVEKISEDATGQDSDSGPEEKKESVPEEKSSKDVMLDDYLGRNTSVVKKNIEEDDLSQKQLENLLDLEKSDKKRESVVEAIEKRLKNFGG